MKKRNMNKTMILIMAVTLMTTASESNSIGIKIPDNQMPFGVKEFKEQSTYESNAYMDNILECHNQNSSYVNSIMGQTIQEKVSMQTSNELAIIDYTNANEGYIMVQYTQETGKKIKATIEGENGTQYIYNIAQQEWTILPITEGNGTYVITVYENLCNDKYIAILKTEVAIELSNENVPFLTSNVYVNFAEAPRTIQKANELTRYAKTDVEKISTIYSYVINNITYDEEKAENLAYNYVTDLDEILESGKGICLDYAALIAGMLRSQNIPCKIVVGYAANTYHAWINVYVETKMTAICGNRCYDEENWIRMDPTWASGNLNSANALLFINEPDNYDDKYCY